MITGAKRAKPQKTEPEGHAPPTDADYRAAMRKQLAKLQATNDDLTSGRISVDEWYARFDAVLVEGHMEALRLGSERGGEFDYDISELKRQARGIVDTESEFLTGYTDEHGVWHRGFIGDLRSGNDPRYFDENGDLVDGSLDSRSDLYVGRMRGTANQAFMDASPDDATFTWVANDGPGECDDCAELGEILVDVPADEFFQYPGDGGTECLSNCLCTVERSDGETGFGHHNADDDTDDEGDTGDETGGVDPLQRPLDLGLIGAPPSGSEPPVADGEEEEPDQFSIGDSITAEGRPAKTALKDALDAIDKLVKVDVVADDPYVLKIGELSRGVLGQHSREGSIILSLNDGLDQRPATAVHEIGHMLDASFLGGRAGARATMDDLYASETAGMEARGHLLPWWDAVTNSKSWKRLRDLLDSEKVDPSQQFVVHAYYTNPKELWARCFAQYIMSGSIDPEIMRQWALVKSETAFQRADLPKVHWSEADFKPIKKEMDALFEELGWKVM